MIYSLAWREQSGKTKTNRECTNSNLKSQHLDCWGFLLDYFINRKTTTEHATPVPTRYYAQNVKELLMAWDMENPHLPELTSSLLL